MQFASGPQLIWGPNAAGKTTLLEAVVLLGLGKSHRTTTDSELIRWGADYLRVEGRVGHADDAASVASDVTLEVSFQAGGRKRIQVNGVPRRPAVLAEHLRTCLLYTSDAADDLLCVD